MNKQQVLVIATLMTGLGVTANSQAENLADIYNLALNADATWQAAQSGYRAAVEVWPQAQARLMPVINFSGGKSRNKQDRDREIIFGAQAPDSIVNTENYALTFTQPVFNLANWLLLRSAEQELLQVDAELATARQELIIRTTKAYFGVLAAYDSRKFAIAEKQAIQRQLDQAQQRFDVGLIAITDVQESKAAFDLSVADEIAAQNNVDVAREVLREVTGQYHPALDILSDNMPLRSPDPANIDEWTAAALKNNLQIIALQTQVEASRHQINVQKSGHLPTVDLIGTHSYVDAVGGAFGDNKEINNEIAVRLNWSLFEGGAVLSRTREAQAQHQQLKNLLIGLQRLTQRNTRSAYLGVISGISRVKALRQAVVSFETALEATQSGFEVGTRTTVDVLDAQRDLFRARRDYAQSRYGYIISALELRGAAGSLGDDDVAGTSNWLTAPTQ